MDSNLEDPLSGVSKLILPHDKLLELSYRVYQPSLVSQLLKGEKNQNLFSESDVSEPNTTVTFRLKDLCKIAIAKRFKSGKLDPRIPEEDLISAGELLNIELPLENIIHIDIESFWRRVFLAKCTDQFLKCQKIHEPLTDYKIEGIQLKLAEIIETTPYEKWDDQKMNNLARTTAPYVQSLHIRKMMPMKKTVIPIDPSSDEVCHHGSLQMVGFLKNLTKIHIEFLPPNLEREYHMRFLLFSCQDIENLARGLSRLANLNHLTIKRSRLDDEKKMRILIRGLVQLPLETVEFSYCELRDNSGLYLGELLHEVKTIRGLELEGNQLGRIGLEPIFYAIRTNQGTLEYFGTTRSKKILWQFVTWIQASAFYLFSYFEPFAGVARNPVTDDGVYMLASALAETNQVTHLNLNGIEVSPMGAKYVVDLLSVHASLRKMEMCCVPLGVDEGDRLIDFLQGNKLLYRLEIRGCGLTMEQEYNICLLLSRNQYFSDIIPNLMEEEIDEYMEDNIVEKKRRVKNPVLLKMNAYMEEKEECYRLKQSLNVISGHDRLLIQKQMNSLELLESSDSGEGSHFSFSENKSRTYKSFNDPKLSPTILETAAIPNSCDKWQFTFSRPQHRK